MPNLAAALMDELLELVFQGAAAPTITGPFEVSLHTGDPGTDRSNEVSTGDWTNYARQNLAKNATDWSDAEADGTGGRRISNDVAVEFGTAAIVNPVNVTWVSVWADDPRQIGNYQLTVAQVVNDTNPVSIPIGQLRQAFTEAA